MSNLNKQIELREPYDYQGSVIEWGRERSTIPLLIQMRLGKTLIVIRWAKEKGEDLNQRRILTVCPKSVIPVWQRELRLEGIEPFVVNSTHVKDPSILPLMFFQNGWYVTNYECLTHTNISTFVWDTVILDESTKIRRDGTKISKKCTEDFKNVPNKAILTGSPAPEGLLDYFNQLKFLWGKVYDCERYSSFRSKYFYPVNGRYRPHRWFKKEFADYLAEHAYILTRKQVKMGDCKKVYEQRYCEMEEEAKKEYKEFELTWINKDFDATWALAAFQRLHQMSGGFPPTAEFFSSKHKLDEIQDLVESGELSDEEGNIDSVVVFCKYTNELKAVKRKLEELGISCCTYSGEDSLEQRADKIDKFNQGYYKWIIVQVSTGSMGVDLSKADTAIYYSNSLSCVDRLQSEDRIINPNKKTPVLYIDLVTSDTIDCDIYQLVESKKTDNRAFLFQVYKNMQARYVTDDNFAKSSEFTENIETATEFLQ